jgi:hypothetical protein
MRRREREVSAAARLNERLVSKRGSAPPHESNEAGAATFTVADLEAKVDAMSARWREARSTKPATLFHYTSSFAAVEGMLSTGILRMSARDCVRGDPGDVRHAERLVQGAAHELWPAFKDTGSRTTLEIFIERYHELAVAEMSKYAIYLGCFTDRHDNTYLWRTYAANCAGYCLELEWLSEEPPDYRGDSIFGLPVSYSKMAERAWLRDGFVDFLKLTARRPYKKKEAEQVMHGLLRHAGYSTFAFKPANPYSAEREYRFVAWPKRQGGGLPVVATDDGRSYLELPLRKGFAKPVLRSLHVGSEAGQAALSDVRRLLDDLQYGATGRPGMPRLLTSSCRPRA